MALELLADEVLDVGADDGGGLEQTVLEVGVVDLDEEHLVDALDFSEVLQDGLHLILLAEQVLLLLVLEHFFFGVLALLLVLFGELELVLLVLEADVDLVVPQLLHVVDELLGDLADLLVDLVQLVLLLFVGALQFLEVLGLLPCFEGHFGVGGERGEVLLEVGDRVHDGLEVLLDAVDVGPEVDE